MTFKLIAGTSGYRGDTLTEITPEAAYRIGNAFIEVLNSRGSNGTQESLSDVSGWKIALAWDTRYGAELLADAASVGVRLAGGCVSSIGIATIGVLSTFVVQRRCDGAIFITGSHMPHTRVGVILMNADGTYCTADITDQVTKRINQEPFVPHKCHLEEIGMHMDMPTGTVHVDYENYILDKLSDEDRDRLSNMRFGESSLPEAAKVLVDTGNGPAGRTAPNLLRHFGFVPVHMHDREMPIPERDSEVSQRACERAIRETQNHGCLMGVCFDTDADRVLFIDETGKAVEDDIVAAIFAKYTLKTGDHMVTPFNCAPLIELVCEELGATIQHCEIGQPDTGRAVKENSATVFAYEASAGKFMFPPAFPWYDGVYAMLRMLAIMFARDKKLSELVAEFRTIFRINRKVDLRIMASGAVPDAIRRACEQAEKKFVDIDQWARDREERDVCSPDCYLKEIRRFGRALSITFQDASRLLLRASGTEPIARSYGIAETSDRAEMLANIGEALLREEVH